MFPVNDFKWLIDYARSKGKSGTILEAMDHVVSIWQWFRGTDVMFGTEAAAGLTVPTATAASTLKKVEKLVAQHESGTVMAGAEDPKAIDPATIFQLIMLVMSFFGKKKK